MEKQNAKVETVFQSDMAGGQFLVEDLYHVEPAGGLDRGELAELVALLVDSSIEIQSSSGAGFARITQSRELTSDPEPSIIPNVPGEVTTENFDGITGYDVATTEEEIDPDTLDISTVHTGGTEDDTNGVGAAASAEYQREYWFRDRLGKGPVFDRHDNIYWHSYHQNSGNNGHSIYDYVTFVWDIFEE